MPNMDNGLISVDIYKRVCACVWPLNFNILFPIVVIYGHDDVSIPGMECCCWNACCEVCVCVCNERMLEEYSYGPVALLAWFVFMLCLLLEGC